jgi:hypothetical protein
VRHKSGCRQSTRPPAMCSRRGSWHGVFDFESDAILVWPLTVVTMPAGTDPTLSVAPLTTRKMFGAKSRNPYST